MGVVHEYLEGKGSLEFLAKNHGAHHVMVERWVAV